MPTLHWIGKEKVQKHHNDVPYRVLEKQYTCGKYEDNTCGDDASRVVSQDNMIIHGDNLEALKALLPEYQGKVDCIYIDPPYNTGNEGWVYNDNVNDPHIRKWLGAVVGKEAEDLTRHDKWLCMMYPRLVLLQKLLSPTGAIFISIDDNEQANLKLICDEIFGAGNFVACYLWNKTSTPPALSKKVRRTHEYILCYNKFNDSSQKYIGLVNDGGDAPILNEINKEITLSFPANYVVTTLPDGIYHAGERERVNLLNDVIVTNGIIQSSFQIKGHFRWTQNTLNNEIAQKCRLIVKSNKFAIRYCRQEDRTVAPPNFITERFYLGTAIDKETNVDTNDKAGEELKYIFGSKVFDFPKPHSLIEYLISFLGNSNALILDSFAGSGTTAHAVLNLNKQDGGHRRFILVEMCDYAETITAERVRRVIDGYGEGSKAVEGTGGSFAFYELGDTIYDPQTGLLNDNADTEQIRRYIWYSETNTPYHSPKVCGDDASRVVSMHHPYLLGCKDGTNYYFYYKRGEETVLDRAFLNTFTPADQAEQYIVYADCCRLSREFMQTHHITFKQIPRDIKKV